MVNEPETPIDSESDRPVSDFDSVVYDLYHRNPSGFVAGVSAYRDFPHPREIA